MCTCRALERGVGWSRHLARVALILPVEFQPGHPEVLGLLMGHWERQRTDLVLGDDGLLDLDAADKPQIFL